MLVVGLTGGIGSGKSTVADMFSRHGVAVTDTDRIARLLTSVGQPALQAIVQQFGQKFLTPEGELDRAALRTHVFCNPTERKNLEQILHPLIRSDVEQELSCPTPSSYRMVVVPLLFETEGYRHIVSRSLLVDCPEPMQVLRTMARNAMGESEVRAMMAAQWTRSQRLSQADDVIENAGSLEQLEQRVAAMHGKYLRLAQLGN